MRQVGPTALYVLHSIASCVSCPKLDLVLGGRERENKCLSLHLLKSRAKLRSTCLATRVPMLSHSFAVSLSFSTFSLFQLYAGPWSYVVSFSLGGVEVKEMLYFWVARGLSTSQGSNRLYFFRKRDAIMVEVKNSFPELNLDRLKDYRLNHLALLVST